MRMRDARSVPGPSGRLSWSERARAHRSRAAEGQPHRRSVDLSSSSRTSCWVCAPEELGAAFTTLLVPAEAEVRGLLVSPKRSRSPVTSPSGRADPWPTHLARNPVTAFTYGERYGEPWHSRASRGVRRETLRILPLASSPARGAPGVRRETPYFAVWRPAPCEIPRDRPEPVRFVRSGTPTPPATRLAAPPPAGQPWACTRRPGARPDRSR